MANNIQQQANAAIGQAASAGGEVQKQATDAIGNARAQAENVANNVQQQANAAIGQAVSVGSEVQKQATDAIGSARAQAESIVNNIQQQSNNALSQAQGTAADIQKQAIDVLSNGGTLVANSIGSLGSQASDAIDQIVNRIGSNPLINVGAQIITTLGNSGIIQTIISTFAIGAQNVTSSQRTVYSNGEGRSNDPALVLNTIAGGSNQFPAFSSRIIQPTSLDSLQRTTTTSSDCGNNGDLRNFAACSAAKAAGLCTLDAFKSRQCRATCGNICKFVVN